MAKTYQEVDAQAINLIGKGTQIKGDVLSDGDMRIDGELNGNLVCAGRLVIGPSGKVTGEVKCKTSEIAGMLEGKLVIDELLSLKSSSKVHGEILTGKLSIEPGALFTGTCKMGSQADNDEGKKQAKA